MTQEEWYALCYEVAKEHPDYIETTIKAFSEGVIAQASYNKEKVANMGAALSALYQFPNEKQWRKLARERLLESKLFEGTEFERKLLKEQK